MKKVLHFFYYLLMIMFITGNVFLPPVYAGKAGVTVCADGCDFTTIQAALDAADTNSTAKIMLEEPIHTEAGIVIDKNVMILGMDSKERPIIQAHSDLENSKNRVFLVKEGVNAVIKGLSIQHGHASFRLKALGGGAIYNSGNLLLEDCLITKNRGLDGGGIVNTGNLTIKNCTLSNNYADAVHPDFGFKCGAGGAIKSEKGRLIIMNCTIHDNESMKHGGGVFVSCKSDASVENTTISGNKAYINGGGIHVRGLLVLTNSTIANNKTNRYGGGICVHGKMKFANNIIANNSKTDCYLITQHNYKGVGSILSNTYNLIADQSTRSEFSGNPKLGPLADNGGKTKTHALLNGSPAIDVLASTECLTETDQRGKPRPRIMKSNDTPCDLGAFELQKK